MPVFPGIPTLVLLDKELEVINQNARSFIEHDENFEVRMLVFKLDYLLVYIEF